MDGAQEVEVLLIEDSAADAELILRALRRRHPAGRIHVAKDGAQALEFFFGPGREDAGLPRLVLLDLHLPRIDGIEVLHRLKADPRLRALPVVVLTSSKQTSDIRECYRLGVNSYIVKPVEFDRFTETVSDLGTYWMLLNESPVVEQKTA